MVLIRIVSISSGDKLKKSHDFCCAGREEGCDGVVDKDFNIVLRCTSVILLKSVVHSIFKFGEPCTNPKQGCNKLLIIFSW